MSQWPGHGTRNTTLPGTRIVSPEAAGIRSRRTMRWVPRLGRMSVVARALDRERAVRQARPDAGRVDDRPGADDEVVAAELVADVDAGDPAALAERAVDAQPGRHGRAPGPGRAGDREREAGVVLDPVVEHERAAQPWPAQDRRVLEGRLDAQVAMPPAVPRRAEQVVQGQARRRRTGGP